MIQKTRAENEAFFRDARMRSGDTFNAARNGFRCEHSLDLFEEVATIARPPVEPKSKRPVTDTTGYIVCVYKVFKGDDGEKFERNWLFWTGEDSDDT